MDETTPAIASSATRPWIGPVAAVAVGGVAALALNLGLGRVVAVPLVDGGEIPAVAGEADPTLGEKEGASPTPDEEALADAVNRAPRLSERQYLDGILGRNLFDPSQIGVEAEADAAGAERRRLSSR